VTLTRREAEEYDRRYEDIETTRRLEAVAENRVRHETERAHRSRKRRGTIFDRWLGRG
jgi:hypothetical protein